MTGSVRKMEDLRLAEERTELALERTREAAERTLMAWIRTSLAMIGFGFGTFKLFELLMPNEPGAKSDPLVVQWLTSGSVGWGTLLLVGAIVQYKGTMDRLRRRFDAKAIFPLVLVGAAGIVVLGLIALVHQLMAMA